MRGQNPANYVIGLFLILWVGVTIYYILQNPQKILEDLYGYNVTNTTTTETNVTTNITFTQTLTLTFTPIGGISYNETTHCFTLRNISLSPSKSQFVITLPNGTYYSYNYPKTVTQKITLLSFSNVLLERSWFSNKQLTFKVNQQAYLSIINASSTVIVKENGTILTKSSGSFTLKIKPGTITIEAPLPSLPFQKNVVKIERVEVYYYENKTVEQSPEYQQFYITYIPSMGVPYLYGDECEIKVNGEYNYYATYGNKLPLPLRPGLNVIQIIKSNNCEIVFERDSPSLTLTFPDINSTMYNYLKLSLSFVGSLRVCTTDCYNFNYPIENYLIPFSKNVTILPLKDTYILYAELCAYNVSS